MQLADLFKEALDQGYEVIWENGHIATPVWVFGIRLYSMGLSVREVAAVLEWLGIDGSHGTVWNWTHKLTDSVRPAEGPKTVRRRIPCRPHCSIGPC